ncbi:hypothetical protein ACWHA1_39160 [Streptomyces decoyicus]
MYEGGQRGRDLSIDRGAARPAADLREELRLVQRALEETWGRLAPEDWRRPVAGDGITCRGPRGGARPPSLDGRPRR